MPPLTKEQAKALGLPDVDTPSMTESAARGAAQGLSLGWSDELAAGLAAALPFLDREMTGNKPTLESRYVAARKFLRGKNAAAQEANPTTYLAGQVAGGVAPTLITGAAPLAGGRAIASSIAQGAGAGAGYSEANDAAGLLGDTALGAGLGLAGHGAGKLVGSGLAWTGKKAGQLANLARARAGVQAAGEVADEIKSAAGALGGETQKGSRYVENLMRLEASMTPEQRAIYYQLQASGVVPALQQSVAQGTLEALPGQAGTIAAKKAALETLQQGAGEAVGERTSQLLKPQVRADLKSFAKAYAEPLAWAVAANQLAKAGGADADTRAILTGAAGLIGGRTRAGKALYTRVTRPAHQLAFAEALKRAAERNGPRFDALLTRAVPATVAATMATREEE